MDSGSLGERRDRLPDKADGFRGDHQAPRLKWIVGFPLSSLVVV
jgi:hypothetical protein